jgi:hypothetical protein
LLWILVPVAYLAGLITWIVLTVIGIFILNTIVIQATFLLNVMLILGRIIYGKNQPLENRQQIVPFPTFPTFPFAPPNYPPNFPPFNAPPTESKVLSQLLQILQHSNAMPPSNQINNEDISAMETTTAFQTNIEMTSIPSTYLQPPNNQEYQMNYYLPPMH